MIELMIVIAIIAIVAAIAIPMYSQYIRSAKKTEAIGELISLTASQEDCFNSYRKYCSIAELETYYGTNTTGDYHKIELTLGGDDQSYTAEVFICYDTGGASCNSGNKDLRCVVTNTSDTPDCS